ncbi:hypothetical protein ACFY5F_00870 [Streptomyces sp. NPDC013161]|uniref:hypothetical protein n=1 Tax=Streptomyces sp. NPDC013161 TaxID=3364862 RepID=UPI0036AC5F77
MSRRQGRGSTGTGRPAVVPAGPYEAPPLVREDVPGTLLVDFHGEDNRKRSYDFSTLPLPGWRPLLARSFALRTGYSGDARTLESARHAWTAVQNWARFLDTLALPPATPQHLTRAHVDAYNDRTDAAPRTRHAMMMELRTQFADPQLKGELPSEAHDAFNRRLRKPEAASVGGYSSGELERLTAAARADTARITRRLRDSEDLLRRYREAPDRLGEEDRSRGEMLAAMAAGGVVPELSGRLNVRLPQRVALASQLFMTWRDLAPLFILLMIVTERNGETIKELPVRHRVLEDRAVELTVVKRRRGTKRWFETVTWEIGPKSRELHTAGGLYLLLLELTARSRACCDASTAIAIWRDGHRAKVVGRDEHWAPFEQNLGLGSAMELSGWAAGRPKPVLADPPPKKKKGTDPPPPRPLRITFNQIKTSADARRTRQLGGHLPSSAKSNTAQTLYRNYLKADEPTREWAAEVVSEALVDAEQAAAEAHERAIARRGGSPKVLPEATTAQQLQEDGLPPEIARKLADGQLDTAWTACEDHDHNPETGKPCGDSFLDCFHCGNCLVTPTHLPRLLSLLDSLGTLRHRMSEDDWWKRYGPVWVAIERDILTKFSPAEVARERAKPLPDAMLDLVEAPWEHP